MKLDELGQISDNILLNSVINMILHINITLLLHEYSLGYRKMKLDKLGQTSDNILLNCDLMGQNQSHVAIFPNGVKYTRF